MNRPAAPTGTSPGGATERIALMRTGALAAAMAGGFGLVVLVLAGSAAVSGLAALGTLAAGAIGYALGRRDGGMPARIRLQMFRVADDLAQYRAFTRLLRDQGARIIESTGEAATVIVTGLREIDDALDRIQAALAAGAGADGEELRGLLRTAGAPIVDMMGQLQFQDVTQQQIDFLSRLSLIVDQHMIDLARQLGDRRSADRIGNFKEMFNKALNDCVMNSQRDDHHVAAGLDLREGSGPNVEMF
jgi:hypothetical protein